MEINRRCLCPAVGIDRLFMMILACELIRKRRGVKIKVTFCSCVGNINRQDHTACTVAVSRAVTPSCPAQQNHAIQLSRRCSWWPQQHPIALRAALLTSHSGKTMLEGPRGTAVYLKNAACSTYKVARTAGRGPLPKPATDNACTYQLTAALSPQRISHKDEVN